MAPTICGSMCPPKIEIVLFLLGVSLVNGLRPGQHIPYFAGPYRVIVGRIGNTSEDYQSIGKNWLRLHTSQVRGRQPQYGWGQAYTSIRITDDMRIELRLASRSNNQWKKNAFVFNLDHACSSILIHGQSIYKMMIGRELDSCPTEVNGLREIKNETFEFVFPKFPVMPYGWYYFTNAVLSDNTVVSVSEGDVHVVPRV